MSSDSSHCPHEAPLVQFSLYGHKGGPRPHIYVYLTQLPFTVIQNRGDMSHHLNASLLTIVGNLHSKTIICLVTNRRTV